jgi:hypothetical protein
VNQQGLAGRQSARLEHIGEDGEDGLGQDRRLDIVQLVWDRQHMAGVDGDPLGIAPAAQQGAHPVADGPARHPFAYGFDLARDLKPENVRSARWRGIAAVALQQVGPIDPGGMDPDDHLAGAGHRIGAFGDLQRLGRS